MDNDSQEEDQQNLDNSGESFNLVIAAKILQVISSMATPAHVSDISRSAELPKSTVFRVLSVLEQAGLIGKHADGRHFGRALELSPSARSALLNKESQETRRQVLESLVEDIGHTCNLTIQNGNSVMYLDRIEKRWPLSDSLHPGTLLPLYASACGKLFLAYMSLAAREKFIRHCPLVQITGKTITNPDLLKQEFSRIREAGYSLDNEEFLPEVYCLAVPVYSAEKKLVAALAMHWGRKEETLGVAYSHLPSLRIAANRIGAMIDW